MRARQAGHLKGIHRRREEGMFVDRQTGVIQVKKHDQFWKSCWREDCFSVHDQRSG